MSRGCEGLRCEGLRLELSQRFTSSIDDIRDGSGRDPKDILSDVVNRVISSIESEGLKKGIIQLFENGRLVSLLKERMDNFAVPSKAKIADFVIEYVYKENNDGHFQRQHESDDVEEALVGSYTTSLASLEAAYSDPDELKRQIEENENIIKAKVDVGERMMDEIGEMRDAQNVMEVIRPEIEIIANTFTYVLITDLHPTPV